MRASILAAGLWLLPGLLAGLAINAHGQASNEAGMQILTRGPVHEAFAESSMDDAVAGLIISRGPPEAISELAPDQRPDGNNVAWIPGYWSWDDERTDYIWVSGVWRDLPPGRQWIPGYWATVHNGTQWISGFWGDVAQTEVVYLPPPPASLESGPNSPLPGPNNFWSPGCWVWQQSRYDWQPGYWVAQQPEWVWAPAHYTWTPRGHIYVPGYWDRDLEHRGVMFAPVYYDQPIYTRSAYVYSPRIVIDIAIVAAFLFVQPRSRHYYYGDYYDRRYEDRGYRPWYAERDSRHGYDANYAHYRSRQLERDSNWDNHIVERFQHRRDNEGARPPRTLDLQVNIFNTRKADAPREFAIGRNLSDAIESKDFGARFRAVDSTEREGFTTRGQDVRKFQLERQKSETSAEDTARPESGRGGDARAARWQMRKSPVAARPVEESVKENAPPPAPRIPAPETRGRGGDREKPVATEGRAAPPQRGDRPGRMERERTAPDAKPVRVERDRQRPSAKPAPAEGEARPERATREGRPATAGPKAASPKAEPRKSYRREPKVEPGPERVKSGREPAPSKREAAPRKVEPPEGGSEAGAKEKKGKRGGAREPESKREKKSGRY
jgi:hypothetical protein